MWNAFTFALSLVFNSYIVSFYYILQFPITCFTLLIGFNSNVPASPTGFLGTEWDLDEDINKSLKLQFIYLFLIDIKTHIFKNTRVAISFSVRTANLGTVPCARFEAICNEKDRKWCVWSVTPKIEAPPLLADYPLCLLYLSVAQRRWQNGNTKVSLNYRFYGRTRC